MHYYEGCQTHPDYLPTEAGLRERKEEYYVLGAYENEEPGDPLGSIFLQRLQLPMVADSQKAGREITLPDLSSVYRWARTEFFQYEIARL